MEQRKRDIKDVRSGVLQWLSQTSAGYMMPWLFGSVPIVAIAKYFDVRAWTPIDWLVVVLGTMIGLLIIGCLATVVAERWGFKSKADGDVVAAESPLTLGARKYIAPKQTDVPNGWQRVCVSCYVICDRATGAERVKFEAEVQDRTGVYHREPIFAGDMNHDDIEVGYPVEILVSNDFRQMFFRCSDKDEFRPLLHGNRLAIDLSVSARDIPRSSLTVYARPALDAFDVLIVEETDKASTWSIQDLTVEPVPPKLIG